LVSGHTTFAVDPLCRPVNLFLNKQWGMVARKTERSKLWHGYTKQMPFYDQGKVPICYAYTAAQMVDYWRVTKGTRVTKSINLSTPLYAALLTRKLESNPYFGQRTIEGGGFVDAITAIKKMGMCSPDVIEKSISQFSKNHKLDPREFFEIVQFFYSQYPEGIKEVNEMSFEDIKEKYIKDMQTIKGNKAFDEGDLPKIFKDVVPYIKDRSIVKYMTQLFKECEKPENIILSTKFIPEPKFIFLGPSNQKSMKDSIKQQLNMPNPQPLGIAYCAMVFFDPKLIGIELDPTQDQYIVKNENLCGPHGSIIIGKKEIKGVCHFLIRNTWGTGCNSYSWPCEKNRKGEATGIWLSEDALINNLLSIGTLPEPDMECNVKVNNKSEDIETMFPNEFYSYQTYELKTWPYELLFEFNEERKRPLFYIKENNSEKFLGLGMTFSDEGQNGILFSKGNVFPNIGRVELTCKKFTPKRKKIKEINYPELFPHWKQKKPVNRQKSFPAQP
jgi:hypothetical protein